MLSTPCFFAPTVLTTRPRSPCVFPTKQHLCVRNVSKKNVAPVLATVAPKQKPATKFVPPPNARKPNYRVLPDVDQVSEEDARAIVRAFPPPPPWHYTVPVVGFFLDLVFNKPTSREKHNRFGGVFTSNGLFGRIHFVTDYTAICDMLADTNSFTSRGSSATLLDIFGPESVGVLDGPEHFHKRALLSPAFSPKLFPLYFELIRRRATRTFNLIADESQEGQTVYLDHTFRELFLSIIVEMTTGLTYKDEVYSEIRKLSARLLRAFSTPPFGPIYNNSMKARARLLEIVTEVIQNATVQHASMIETLRSHGDRLFQVATKNKVNILLVFLAVNKKIRTGVENDPEVFVAAATDIVALWFAGYATSAATATCTSFEMIRDSKIWTQLQKEQEDIINNHNAERIVELSQLHEMVLLDSFINEILRLFPAAPGGFRKCIRDVEVFGRHINKGSLVFFYYAAAMLDDNFYPDAEVLKVDRFVTRPGKPAVPKVLTFSPPGTVHYCLGSQMTFLMIKTTFALMLRNYESVTLDPRARTKYRRVPENVPVSRVAVTEIKRRVQN